MNKNVKVTVTVILAVVIVLGVWYLGKNQGYKMAIADIRAQQEEAGNKAVKAATNDANPFKVSNPLQGIEANPFEKARKTLNPFD